MCGELCSKCFDQNNSNGKFGQHVLIKRCRTTHILQGNWFRKRLVEAKPNVKLLQTKVANSHPLYKGNEFRNNVCRNNTNESVFKTKIFTTTYTFIRKPVFEKPKQKLPQKYRLNSQNLQKNGEDGGPRKKIHVQYCSERSNKQRKRVHSNVRGPWNSQGR